MKILAFDYGASSGRAILGQFDGNKLSLKETHRFSSDPVYINGSFTWDFLRLFHEMKQGILKTYREEPDIASIGVDTWGVDFGLLTKDGDLLANPVHYRDKRTDGMIEEALKLMSKEEIYNETGIAFQKFNSLYQLLSMSKNDSVILKNASSLLFIPDLFNFYLTGQKVSEYTITSTSQMYNPVKERWSYEILDKLGIRTDILTEVVPAGTRLGGLTKDLCNELGINPIPVTTVCGHDTGSAVVSVPFTEDNCAYLSSGTWSLLGVELDKPIINQKTLGLNYTNEGGINNNVRLLKNIMGLWINQECKRYWERKGDKISFDELDQGALDAKAFKAIIDVDHPSFFEPGNMPKKIQDYCKNTGQNIPETKGEIARCVMESLALKYRYAISSLEEIIGKRINKLHIVGGGCKNRILSQFTANAINRPVIAGPIEATSIGNLSVQLISLSEVKDLKEARQLIANSFEQEHYLAEDVEAWDEAYNKFLKLQEKTSK